MKDSSQPVKRRHYDAAFRAEALRLASESRSTQNWLQQALAAFDPANISYVDATGFEPSTGVLWA